MVLLLQLDNGWAVGRMHNAQVFYMIPNGHEPEHSRNYLFLHARSLFVIDSVSRYECDKRSEATKTKFYV